ncbi:hypothetical protein BASA81_012805 [Batrachochytrium salamandrivorans]|nr:hypothetical protein BASA81_012805 [Batrachochytrium salamandrivorans]
MASSKATAMRAMQAVLRHANPLHAVKCSVTIDSKNRLLVNDEPRVDLSDYQQTYVLGAGKASCEMASALLQVEGFAATVTGGLVITKAAHGRDVDRALCATHRVRVVEAAHPLPCETGASAVRDMISLLHQASSKQTLVIWLASGGGSALTGGLSAYPLHQLQDYFSQLLASGLAIEEMNTIRKHICLAHGGRMALHAGEHTTVLTLCISDIIDSPVHSIAGGPTALDPTTLEDCRRILASCRPPLSPAMLSLAVETPKHLPSNILAPVVIIDNRIVLERAMRECREEMPWLKSVALLTHRLDGEAAQAGKLLANVALDCTLPRPFLLFAGGETTVTMPSSTNGTMGVGGRNQELALAAAVQFAKSPQQGTHTTSLLCVGTDGTDGPTSAAGAVVDSGTLAQSPELFQNAVD